MEEISDLLLPKHLGSYKRGVIDVESFKRLKEFVDKGFDRFGIPKTMYANRRLTTVQADRRRRKSAPYRKKRPASKYSYGGLKRNVPRNNATAARVGYPVGTSTAKRVITNNQWAAGTNLSAPLLYDSLINDVEQADDAIGVEINRRTRQMINLIGFDFRFYAQNNSASLAQQVNWAIVSPKGANGIEATKFFRGYDVNRGQDFNAVSSGAEMLNMSPINRDKYHVLHQEKYVLGPSADLTNGSADLSRRSDNYKAQKVWIPINRQIRFSTIDKQSVDDPIYLVYWCCPLGWVPGAPAANMWDFRTTVIAYFKEPGMA
mgnify:CR=1 FL=1